MDDSLPDDLGLFHALLRLRSDIRVRYEGPIEEGSYIIALFSPDGSSITDIDYDPRRQQPFAWGEQTTAEPEELLAWIENLITSTPA